MLHMYPKDYPRIPERISVSSQRDKEKSKIKPQSLYI